MSSHVTEIRLALEDIIREADGVNEVSAYPPMKVVKNGTVWVDNFSTQVRFGSPEVHVHTVTVICVANRAAELAPALLATEPIIDSIMHEIRQHMDLGLGPTKVGHVQVLSYRHVPVLVGNVVHLGFDMTVEVTQLFRVDYTE